MSINFFDTLKSHEVPHEVAVRLVNSSETQTLTWTAEDAVASIQDEELKLRKWIEDVFWVNVCSLSVFSIAFPSVVFQIRIDGWCSDTASKAGAAVLVQNAFADIVPWTKASHRSIRKISIEFFRKMTETRKTQTTYLQSTIRYMHLQSLLLTLETSHLKVEFEKLCCELQAITSQYVFCFKKHIGFSADVFVPARVRSRWWLSSALRGSPPGKKSVSVKRWSMHSCILSHMGNEYLLCFTSYVLLLITFGSW